MISSLLSMRGRCEGNTIDKGRELLRCLPVGLCVEESLTGAVELTTAGSGPLSKVGDGLSGEGSRESRS